jgi:hypothetical protein
VTKAPSIISHRAGKVLWLARLYFLALIAVVAACDRENSVVLHLKDVQFFSAEEISHSPLTIRISGLAFHSSLAVQHIVVVRDKDSLQVLVYLTPTRQGLSGNFSYDLVIPNEINDVRFGEEKASIWHRNTASNR